MAYIAEVSEEQAEGGLRESYARIRQEFGFLPHFWQAQGSRPDIVQASLELWRVIYRAGVLPAALKEKIGLVVSAANSNSYCITAHLELLRRLGVEKALGRQLVHDYEAAPVDEREKSLFRFAEKITREPFKIKESDVSELRRHGWDDAALLEVALVASHFNFLNRLAAALGLIPEHVF
ncbi:MAG: carboxymuconolactone decarboxylase family protein [Terriglobia bacterium]